MPDEMDVQRLIAEVKRRPTLWDVRFAEYKDRTNTPQQWQEIADLLGIDVEHCKRKWKNLRDAYRAEVRRTERRQERLRASGQCDPTKTNTSSKWVYFEPMSFINESKRARHSIPTNSSECQQATTSDGSPYETKFHSFCDIKMEPHHTTDEDDDEDDMLFEEFQNAATPQAVRRLSSSIANVAAGAEEAAASAEPGASSSCKCNRRSDDQVHFLETLEREEQKLMQSTRKDMSRSDNMAHVGDSDYNFLVSFLPQMKKMCELQNLQFRAKMSELVLNIMSPPPPPQPQPAAPAPPATPIALPALTHTALSSGQGMMNISTTTPMRGMMQCAPSSQQRQQQQLQMLQSELMEAEQTDNDAIVNAVATSSSNWN